MSDLTYTPELAYYLEMSESPAVTFKIESLMNYTNVNYLFNLGVTGDIFMQFTKTSPLFIEAGMLKYTRFITLEAGMFGMFYKKSPRQYIEGYRDPLLTQLSSMPMFMGGDRTNPPVMSINDAPTTSGVIPVWYLTGEDDKAKLREMVGWYDRTYITIKRQDYADIYNLMTIYQEPW